MKWILWRECRLNQLILITGTVLLLLPYLIALIIVWWPTRRVMGAPELAMTFGVAAIYSVVISQLTVALLGGNAIAGERADRSAEFLAYLPLSRARQVGGKVTLALSTTALIWATNILVLLLLARLVPELRSGGRLPNIPQLLSYVAMTGLVFYGVSWLVSSFQSSTTFAVAGGLVTPLLVITGLHTAAWLFTVPATPEFVDTGYAIICPILAVAGFLMGTLYFLYRVEP